MSCGAKILVVIVVLVWGFNFAVIRWGIESIDPAMMTSLRFLFTSIPMIFFIKKPKVKMLVVATYGVLFGAGVWGLINVSIALGTPSGIASLLLQSSAFFTILVAAVFFKEKIAFTKKIGLGLAFIGFSVILFFREESVTIIGVVLVLLSAMFWTICNVIIKKYKPDDIVSFITWSSLFVPVPVLLFSFGQEFYATGTINFSNVMSMPNSEAWVSILFQAYITTLLGYGIWAWAITRYGLSDVAPFSLLIPVAGIFFGWLIYDEMLSMASVFGSVLILLGLAFLFFSDLYSYNRE